MGKVWRPGKDRGKVWRPGKDSRERGAASEGWWGRHSYQRTPVGKCDGQKETVCKVWWPRKDSGISDVATGDCRKFVRPRRDSKDGAGPRERLEKVWWPQRDSVEDAVARE